MTRLEPTCQLEEYGVAFVKHGRRLSTKRAKIERLRWGRNLDDVSGASIDLITAGADCCGELGAVDHWNTEMIIFALGASGKDEVVWRGPCMKPEFLRGRVRIAALDVLKWLQVRLLEQAMTFTNEDLSKQFVAIAQYAFNKDATYGAPEHTFVTYASGVKESRAIDTQSLRYAWNVAREMLDTGLDVTTFGSQILVGTPAFSPIALLDTDIAGGTDARGVAVIKDGSQYAGRVIANASRDIMGIWPPGPAQGVNGYPLVETLLSDTQITDQAGATAAAQARWKYSENGVRRVDAQGGLLLSPTSGIDVKRLLGGQLFNFQATETCYNATETMRLGSLEVEVTQGRQKATIGLQPVGALAGDDLAA